MFCRKLKIGKFEKNLLTKWKFCDRVSLFEAINSSNNTSKQSFHSHPMAIGLIGVYHVYFMSVFLRGLMQMEKQM